MNAYSIEDIYRLNKESHTQSGQFTSGYDVSQLPFYRTHFPELIVFKLYKIDRAKTLSNCEVLFYDLNNIHLQDKIVVNVSTSLDFIPRNEKDRKKATILYEILKSTDSLQGMYFIDHSSAFNLLESHENGGHLERMMAVNVNGISHEMFVSVLNLSKIDFTTTNSNFIGLTRASDWVGSIYLKDIKNANFLLKHQQLIVAKNSSLALDVLNLFNGGQHFKLCSLINQLELAKQGFPSELVKKYL